MFLLMAASWVPYAFSVIEGKTTPSNVEGKAKVWLETFHLGIQTLPDNPTQFFMFAITTHNDRRIILHRSKEVPGYLQFQGMVKPLDADRARMEKLKSQDKEAIATELRLELERQRISFVGIEPPLEEFSVIKSVPIELLTEASFMQAVDDTEFAEDLVIDTFRKELTRRSSQ